MAESFTHRFDHECGTAFIMKHEAKFVKIVMNVIEQMEVDLIIELGTFRGGFTKYLEDKFPRTEIHTYDLHNQTASNRKYFGENVTFHIENVLDRCPSLMELLARDDKKLLYCDNGKKRQEVQMYSWQLNPGDFIGTHDWKKEIFPKDVSDYLYNWKRFGWNTLKESGASSRFWKRQERK